MQLEGREGGSEPCCNRSRGKLGALSLTLLHSVWTEDQIPDPNFSPSPIVIGMEGGEEPTPTPTRTSNPTTLFVATTATSSGEASTTPLIL